MRVLVDGTRYKRRGAVCWFTFALAWDEPLTTADGESYTTSSHWDAFEWTGQTWTPAIHPTTGRVGGHSHPTYPPPREPTLEEKVTALRDSPVDVRARDAILHRHTRKD